MRHSVPHLSNLLREHDCVIIPGLGGLLCSYRSASIHATQHIFSAPSRNILFNKNLQTDDGLLAHALASAENLPMREAKTIIEKEVSEVVECLRMGKTYSLDGIGIFMVDVEKNIRFIQSDRDNYLNDSFGLFTFQTQPVQRQTLYTRPIADAPVQGLNIRKRKPIRWARLALIPLLALLAYLPFSPVLRNASSLNVFSTATTKEQTEAFTYKPRKSNTADSFQEIIELNETTEESIIDLSEGTLNPVVLNFAVAETTDTSIPESISSRMDDHTQGTSSAAIITGCFSIYTNAENQIQMLRSKGIQAEIIGKNASGLYRTGVKFNPIEPESSTIIQKVKNEVAGAWTLNL